MSYLGIDFVQDPSDDSYDFEAQVNGHDEVDGEEDLPERRHRERLISTANSGYVEDVIWYRRRLASLYR